MITIDANGGVIITLGDPDPATAGAGKIVAIDQDIFEWLERWARMISSMASITRPRCGLTSYNINDVRERYCGACYRFADDP